MDDKSQQGNQFPKYVQSTKRSAKPPLWFLAGVAGVLAFVIIGLAVYALMPHSQPVSKQSTTTPKMRHEIIVHAHITASNETATQPIARVIKENKSKKNIDYFALAKKTHHVQYCLKVNASDREACFEYLIPYNQSTCAHVSNPDLRKKCVLLWVKRTNNTKLCSILPPTARQQCYEEVDPCATAKDRNLCEALLYHNYHKCGGDESCLFQYAWKKHDVKACDSFDLISERRGCLSLATDDDMCSNLTGALADLCYLIYANYSQEYVFCHNVNGSRYAFLCFRAWAIHDQDPSHCADVPLLERWDCYTDYALATKDWHGCNDISTFASGSRNGCFYNLAVETRNPCLCMNITDNIGAKLKCYSTIIFSNDTNQTMPLFSKNCYCLPTSWKEACLKRSTG